MVVWAGLSSHVQPGEQVAKWYKPAPIFRGFVPLCRGSLVPVCTSLYHPQPLYKACIYWGLSQLVQSGTGGTDNSNPYWYSGTTPIGVPLVPVASTRVKTTRAQFDTARQHLAKTALALGLPAAALGQPNAR
jgi:hypothetical protein